jgi:hypothetical protein
MSLTRVAKAVGLCVLIALGGGLIAGLMMGGGYSGSSNRFNDDPRSVLVETIIVEYEASAGTAWAEVLGPSRAARTELDARAFGEFVAQTRAAAAKGEAVVRMPSAIVQHNEQGKLLVKGPHGEFAMNLAPRVLKNDVLRIAIETQWDAQSSSGDPRRVELSTSFTSDGSGGVVLDLAGAGRDGGGIILAIRPTLLKVGD